MNLIRIFTEPTPSSSPPAEDRRGDFILPGLPPASCTTALVQAQRDKRSRQGVHPAAVADEQIRPREELLRQP